MKLIFLESALWETRIRRWFLTISHAFVEDNMPRRFDFLRLSVVVEGVTHCLAVSEEDAFSTVYIKFGISVFSGE